GPVGRRPRRRVLGRRWPDHQAPHAGDRGRGPHLSSPNLVGMCRNITELRGLEPPATPEEIDAAALHYGRQGSGITKPNPAVAEAMHRAAREIADITERLLADVPARRQPPATLPPLRRPEVRARLGLEPMPTG